MLVDDSFHLSTLYVDNNITNHGEITGNNLRFNIGADIWNNGTWVSSNIIFDDTTNHYLEAYQGSVFSPYAIDADSAKISSSGNIYLDSVKLRAKYFNLGNNDPLYPADTLSLTNSSILNVDEFTGNNSYIELNNNSILTNYISAGHYSSGYYSDVTLKGDVLVNGALHFFGDVYQNGTMQPANASLPTIYVHGTFYNNGTIEANCSGDNFNFNISGNFTNNGN